MFINKLLFYDIFFPMRNRYSKIQHFEHSILSSAKKTYTVTKKKGKQNFIWVCIL